MQDWGMFLDDYQHYTVFIFYRSNQTASVSFYDRRLAHTGRNCLVGKNTTLNARTAKYFIKRLSDHSAQRHQPNNLYDQTMAELLAGTHALTS